jgi:hypothetical protein
MIKLKSAIALIIGVIAVLIVGPSSALAQNNFNEADFKIKDFGIKDGNPWLTVEGKAGASTPENASQIYAYAFVTDNGTYAVTSHGGEDSVEVENDTQWHTHGVTLDDKNCAPAAKINDDGDAEVNDMVKVTNVTATKVDTVMTALLGINNAPASVCVEKVIDSGP